MAKERETNKNLCEKAEDQSDRSDDSPRTTSDVDIMALLHELQAHQIELEIQNEELQQANLKLEDALQKYSDLYNFAPVGYLTIDSKGIIKEANLTAGELLGQSRSNMIKAPFRLFVSPKSYTIFDNCRAASAQKDATQSCELVLLRNRDESFNALVEISASGDGRSPFDWWIAITNISSRKHAEDALKRAYDEMEDMVEEHTRELKEANETLVCAREVAERRSAELESFIAGIADGVVLLDANGSITFMNDVGMDILGVPVTESFDDFLTRYRMLNLEGSPIPKKENPIIRALGGKAVADMRVKMIAPWDREVTLSISASPVMNDKGKVIGASIVFRDQSGRVAQEKERQDLLEREQHIAEVLQKALLPTAEYDIPGCEIAVRYKPAHKEADVGGDFYDVFHLENKKVGIVIGDVVGKGLPAAISVAAAKHSIRSYAYIDPRPGRVMTLANEALCKDQPGEPIGILMTAFFVVVDIRFGGIAYSNGGHEPPFIRKVNGCIENINICGRALGIEGGFDYPEDGRRLQPGDMMVMVTDGITEAHKNSSSFFGVDGIEQYLLEHPDAPPNDVADGLLAAARDFAGGVLGDDAAIVVIQMKNGDI